MSYLHFSSIDLIKLNKTSCYRLIKSNWIAAANWRNCSSLYNFQINDGIRPSHLLSAHMNDSRHIGQLIIYFFNHLFACRNGFQSSSRLWPTIVFNQFHFVDIFALPSFDLWCDRNSDWFIFVKEKNPVAKADTKKSMPSH